MSWATQLEQQDEGGQQQQGPSNSSSSNSTHHIPPLPSRMASRIAPTESDSASSSSWSGEYGIGPGGASRLVRYKSRRFKDFDPLAYHASKDDSKAKVQPKQPNTLVKAQKKRQLEELLQPESGEPAWKAKKEWE